MEMRGTTSLPTTTLVTKGATAALRLVLSNPPGGQNDQQRTPAHARMWGFRQCLSRGRRCSNQSTSRQIASQVLIFKEPVANVPACCPFIAKLADTKNWLTVSCS